MRNLTPEQYAAKRAYDKERDAAPVNLTCAECGAPITITFGRWRKTKNSPHYCDSCYRKIVGNRSKNMSEEDRKKRSESCKASWANKSDEEKRAFSEKKKLAYQNLPSEEKKRRSQQSKELWLNSSDEYKLKHSMKSRETMKNYWDNISDEEYDRRREESSKQLAEWRNNVTEEEKARISKKESESQLIRWKSMSEEDREAFAKRTSEFMTQWWATVSDEKTKAMASAARLKSLMQWEQMTREQYMDWIKARNDSIKSTMNSMGDEKYFKTELEFVQLLRNYGIMFEDHWCNEHPDPDIERKSEVPPLRKKNFISGYHMWDFRLNFELFPSVLVDIDGMIHDIRAGAAYYGEAVVLNNEVYDAMRIYERDEMNAYIVRALDNIIHNDTEVIELPSQKTMKFSDFVTKLVIWNTKEDDLKAKNHHKR